jgi:diadenosine tetraphosphatase ApaH/serine/threonine PP2A family protein phosphatase
VHGTPRRPITEYLVPEDAINSPVKKQQIFDRIEKHCLVGHTHWPGVFTDEPDFYTPDDLSGVYKFDNGEKTIINPGSVGQPRDSDPRASYAVLDHDKNQVEFHRVDYDVDSVVAKIHAIPELTDWLGDRLLQGR